jgi:hypothetical protein
VRFQDLLRVSPEQAIDHVSGLGMVNADHLFPPPLSILLSFVLWEPPDETLNSAPPPPADSVCDGPENHERVLAERGPIMGR